MAELQFTLHPMVVHFHVGLLVGAFAFEVLGTLARRASLRQAAFYMMWAGFLGLLVSLPTGLWAAGEQPKRALHLVRLHRDSGLTATIVFAFVLGLRTLLARRKEPGAALRWGYAGLLVVAIVLLGMTGYFGGKLVWG